MNKSPLIFIANAMNDEDFSKLYETKSQDAMKLDYEQARRDYDKWLETISNYEAHETAFDIVENLERVTSIYAYSKGFKAGLKLIYEILS